MSVRLTRREDAVEFWRLYGYLSRALALRRAVVWGTCLLAFGLAASTLAVLALRLLGRGLPPLPTLFAPALVLGALGLLVGYLRRDQPERAVWLADTHLDLKERLTTALELIRTGSTQPLAAAQVSDAVMHFARFDPLDAFPVRIPLRAGNLAVILAVLLPIAALAPNPLASPAKPMDRSREIAKEEAEKIDQLSQELAQQQNSQSEEIRRLLQEASKAMNPDTHTPDQSLAALDDLQDQLYRLDSQDSQGLDAALAALAASLASTPGQQDLAKRLATGDLKQVSSSLRRLANDQKSLDPTQRAQLAQALQAAAQSAGQSNARFAQQLQAAANALNSGQQDSAEQAQQALNNAAAQAEAASNRERALSQLQSSRANLARSLGQQPTAGRSNGGGQRGQSQNPGDNPRNQTQGGQQGNSSDQGQGDGAQQGREQANNQQGSQPGGSSAGTGDAPGQGDQIYDPLFSGGHPEQVPGQDQPDSASVSPDPYLSPAEQNGSQVGYRDVYGQYQQRAVKNIEQTYVPLGLKDLVRQYFDELDPNKSGG